MSLRTGRAEKKWLFSDSNLYLIFSNDREELSTRSKFLWKYWSPSSSNTHFVLVVYEYNISHVSPRESAAAIYIKVGSNCSSRVYAQENKPFHGRVHIFINKLGTHARVVKKKTVILSLSLSLFPRLGVFHSHKKTPLVRPTLSLPMQSDRRTSTRSYCDYILLIIERNRSY